MDAGFTLLVSFLLAIVLLQVSLDPTYPARAVRPRCSHVRERMVTDRPFLPVLYASGYTDSEAIGEHALGRGWQYLAKPYSASDLLREVRSILDRDGVAVERGDREPRSIANEV